MRRTGSTTVMTNGRPISVGSSSRNRNQLEPSPQELPVKDTDHTIDVGSAERKFILIIDLTFGVP